MIVARACVSMFVYGVGEEGNNTSVRTRSEGVYDVREKQMERRHSSSAAVVLD